MQLTRRQMMKLSLLGGGSLALPLSRALGTTAMSPVVQSCPPFSAKLPIPRVLIPDPTVSGNYDFYKIEMREGEAEILCDGRLTKIWGYNGLYPGPTIMARSGRPVVVHQTNSLQVDTSIHLHGGHTPPDSDGHPRDRIVPGGEKKYYYPNKQDGTTLWYHDHVDAMTGFNVYKGLAAFYILEDSPLTTFRLPKAIPLMIQDRNFDADGQLLYNPSGPTGEFFGQTPVLNGRAQPYLKVLPRKTRFRIVNGSNARIYRLELDNGESFIQIGTDGGFLEQPKTVASLVLAPAERVDLFIDFVGHPGENIILKNMGIDAEGTADLMQFQVDASHPVKIVIPPVLRDIKLLQESDVVRRRDFDLELRMGVWFIGGRTFNPEQRVAVQPNLNDVEIWTFRNLSNLPHPIHIHDIMFQIFAINGVPLSDEERLSRGWKDTFLVSPQGTVQPEVSFIMQFTDNVTKGAEHPYVFHCHMLEHEDMGMMDEFDVLP